MFTKGDLFPLTMYAIPQPSVNRSDKETRQELHDYNSKTFLGKAALTGLKPVYVSAKEMWCCIPYTHTPLSRLRHIRLELLQNRVASRKTAAKFIGALRGNTKRARRLIASVEKSSSATWSCHSGWGQRVCSTRVMWLFHFKAFSCTDQHTD